MQCEYIGRLTVIFLKREKIKNENRYLKSINHSCVLAPFVINKIRY